MKCKLGHHNYYTTVQAENPSKQKAGKQNNTECAKLRTFLLDVSM